MTIASHYVPTSVRKEGNQPNSKAGRLHTRGLQRKEVERETGLTSPVPNPKSNSFIGFGIDLKST
jgi:hypothetical protein